MSILVLFLILSFYAGILSWLAVGFLRTPVFLPSHPVSIPLTLIICARNEARTIVACIQSILKQDYDLSRIQLILVDDASNDDTVERAKKELLVSGISYELICNNKQLGKKKSITEAISMAKHELLVMRDADTFTRSDQWLKSIVSFYLTNKADLIIAPMIISDGVGMLWALQAVENNVLTLFSSGSTFYQKPFLCHGANMAFTKTIFQRVNGYSSHLHIASGDDVLFLEDVKNSPGARISYLRSKEAIVSTYAENSLISLLSQKIRWASKFKHHKNKLNRVLAGLSVFVNTAFLFSIFIFCFGSAHKIEMVLFIAFKLLIDYLLLFLASSLINNKRLWWYVVPISFIYPCYAIATAIGTLIVKPNWKP